MIRHLAKGSEMRVEEEKQKMLQQEMQQMLRRQMYFFAQMQEQIQDEARQLVESFYVRQKARSQAIRKESDLREWSDLSVQVRLLRGQQVTIHWRKKNWYRSSRDGKLHFQTEHITKPHGSHDYKKTLAKQATSTEYEDVMALEGRFSELREYAKRLHQMQADLRKAANQMELALPESERTGKDRESAWAIQERIGNLIHLLKYRLWPNESEADQQAGFIPMVDGASGLGHDIDPRKVRVALDALMAAHEVLLDVFSG